MLIVAIIDFLLLLQAQLILLYMLECKREEHRLKELGKKIITRYYIEYEYGKEK